MPFDIENLGAAYNTGLIVVPIGMKHQQRDELYRL